MDERQKPRTGVQGFLGCPKVDLALRMLSIVLLTAHLPEVSIEGFLTGGEVLLSLEGLLIRRDGGQVLGTSLHRCTNRCETQTCIDLILAQVGRALRFLTEIKAVTLIALGRCHAVRTEEHFGTRVLTALARFTECAGYRVDTGAPFCFCHNC